MRIALRKHRVRHTQPRVPHHHRLLSGEKDNSLVDWHRLRQHRHSDERTRCTDQHRFRDTHGKGRKTFARNSPHRHMRRTATLYTDRHIHLLYEIHRIRRAAQLLCREKRDMRSGTGRGIQKAHRLVTAALLSIRGHSRPRAGGENSRKRHDQRGNHIGQRLFRTARQTVARAARRCGAECQDRIVRI